jgi:hypothetical protein
MMTPIAAVPDPDLLQLFSMALQTAPLMSKVHDPDHVLSDDNARHLLARLEHFGLVISMHH